MAVAHARPAGAAKFCRDEWRGRNRRALSAELVAELKLRATIRGGALAPRYSARRATSGSTRIARRAGTRQAAMATIETMTPIATNVPGSVDDVCW